MELDSQLASTTAPGKLFASREELAAHYKSDWHKYNLKRREAGLPMLLEPDFQARLDAALALRQEKETGTSHLKKESKKHFKKKRNGISQVSQASAYDRMTKETETPTTDSVDVEPTAENSYPTTEEPAAPEAIEIEPRQCLFDRHMSVSVQANVERMQRKYGFFIPDAEYLTDLTGLVGYCHEKIKLGHVCLYCQKVFTTWQGCQKHMISKRHTKLRYEPDIDLEEFAVFYDFAEADAEYLGRPSSEKKTVDAEMEEVSGDDEDWEDISDDEVAAMDVEDDDHDNEVMDNDFDEAIARMGFDVTALGELVLPDGRIIGHRLYRRYYKQRAPRTNTSNEAVNAARLAASERLYRGKVYRIGYQGDRNSSNDPSSGMTALMKAGIAPGMAAGRAGKGLLVKSGGSFTAMSIYRYQAAMRKQRKGDVKGLNLYNRTSLNMNRMDKKHNRLMNGVSVAHAKR
ncbi:pre-60S factor REI1 [Fistulifera solaris]|uniref:Pre-60S factor REI1 n=1 Tax=Fistulifera solaris TaxID=1519565 RepID=A0A1Z5JHF3_FISSO|nr:pre-60S factor REI1 [Fistulifera solaris]|eukprot:GAX13322.1 pre-60S factor REI1 [Fistulifera solaris]